MAFWKEVKKAVSKATSYIERHNYTNPASIACYLAAAGAYALAPFTAGLPVIAFSLLTGASVGSYLKLIDKGEKKEREIYLAQLPVPAKTQVPDQTPVPVQPEVPTQPITLPATAANPGVQQRALPSPSQKLLAYLMG